MVLMENFVWQILVSAQCLVKEEYPSFSYVHEVEKFAADPKVPFILCGDFNANSENDAYKFVTEGKLDLEAGELKFTYVQAKGYSDIEKAVFKHLKPKRGTSLVSAYAHFFGSLPLVILIVRKSMKNSMSLASHF